MSDLVYVHWNQEEWEARFRGRRRYPRSEDQERALLGLGGFASVYRVRIAGQVLAAKVLNMENLGLDEGKAVR